MNNIIDNLKKEFREGTILNKLIYINIAAFILLSIINVFSFMFEFNTYLLLDKLYLPANITNLVKQPWSIISYMFLHNGLLHILFNMIWLHFAGKLFLQYLNPQQLLTTYILGGISGGIIFILAYNYIPVFQGMSNSASAIGASASVLAIMIAIATYVPNYAVRLPFFGFIKLKYIAIFIVTIDLLSIPNANAGGHLAHIGGALFGYFYIIQMKKGTDYSIYFLNLLKLVLNTFKRKKRRNTKHSRPKSDYDFNSERSLRQREIDKILEKIANSGYDSLSKTEKAILFNASKK